MIKTKKIIMKMTTMTTMMIRMKMMMIVTVKILMMVTMIIMTKLIYNTKTVIYTNTRICIDLGRPLLVTKTDFEDRKNIIRAIGLEL